ncbi:MAG: hypothetical protein ACTS22_06040 [Phycisphaerales bacterium]
MALIYCGIDEAGYGPMLGPLCVARAVFRLDEADEADPVPDLWALLERAVCRSLNDMRADRRHRIAVADSKKLKLPNQSVTRHPLLHLERGVLAMLMTAGIRPDTDESLFSTLGCRLPDEPWYGGPATRLPVGTTADDIAIAANQVAAASGVAGVRLEDLACRMVGERSFNERVKECGSKAAVTAHAVREHLAAIRGAYAHSPAGVRIVCDRLGGRAGYLPLLQAAFPDDTVRALAESPEKSAYEVVGWARPARVLFMTESESAHLPVALASMAAKLTRELSMARLNRHFAALLPDLKPTAGYVTDARRWLRDVDGMIDGSTRRRLVRVV